MPAVPADLSIKCRWIAPMSAAGRVLENHAIVVRDGKILDILPGAAVAERYAASIHVERHSHVLIPGFVDARARGALAVLPPYTAVRIDMDSAAAGDGVRVTLAALLRSGGTCIGDVGYFPVETAECAAAQGIRAVVGLPVAGHASRWAASTGEYLTRALSFRDAYQGHPLISTAFAPHGAESLSDATFLRIATLADELDCAVLIRLQESAAEIDESLARHGMRPLARLQSLGLLTPALNAAHISHVTPQDLDLAVRSGISVTLSVADSLRRSNGIPPIAALSGAGIRLAIGSDGAGIRFDPWTDMKLLALLGGADGGSGRITPWDALAIATRGGAAALGLDAEVGTLEIGKWADLCCVDLGGPAVQPVHDPIAQLVFAGGRDCVSDVWVAGRPLVSDHLFTRFVWPELAARTAAWAERFATQG